MGRTERPRPGRQVQRLSLIAAIGVIYFHEPLTALKLVSIGLIIAGVAGLGYVGVGR